jgi:hypothetical protein
MSENLPVISEHKPGMLKPMFSAGDVLEAQNATVELVKKALQEGRDYGVIPHTDKPTLFKAGAERLCKAFGVIPTYEIIHSEVDHDKEISWKKQKWNKGQRCYENVNGVSSGLYRFGVKCVLTTLEGKKVGEGIGSCSTLESKYIEKPRDAENTILKMAKKRAFVDASLDTFSLSDRFTQDYEPEEKKTPSIYKGTKEQQEKIADILRAKNVPDEKWLEISEKLMDRPSTDLYVILKELGYESKEKHA